jgi:cob(I)alamin adenosyltransferase
MPTLDDLQEADRKHEAAIAAVEARLNGHDTMLKEHQAHLFRLDETMAAVRESMGKVATKDDIMGLRTEIMTQHTKQLQAANDAIPARVGAWVGIGGLILAMLGFASTYLHGIPHG